MFNEKLCLAGELFTQLDVKNLGFIAEFLGGSSPSLLLQNSFEGLLASSSSKTRLKGLSILKQLFERFIELNNYQTIALTELNQSDGVFIKLMLSCLRKALENERDSKLQFNALLILDQLFQHLFKGPTLQQEIAIWNRVSSPSTTAATTADDDPFIADTPFELDSPSYLLFRQKEITKLWSIIGVLIDSPWSNIRSIAYGIVCYWVRNSSVSSEAGNRSIFKPFLTTTSQSVSDSRCLSKLKRILEGLLGSKESECRTGGLNILGSLCGLGYNFEGLEAAATAVDL